MVFKEIGEAILLKVANAAVERLGERFTLGDRDTTEVDAKGAKKALEHHLGMIAHWAPKISFRDLPSSKDLRTNFINLDLHLGQVRMKSTPANLRLKVTDILDLPGHFVILGDAGSGKTTSLQRIAIQLLDESRPKHPVPVLVRLRELTAEGTLVSSLLGILGIYVRPVEGTPLPQVRKLEQRAITEALDRLGCYLLVDGLDELNPRARINVLEDLRYLLLHAQRARVFLTSRIAEFKHHFENASVVDIRPLDDKQVREFAEKWLGTRSAAEFLDQIKDKPYSGTEIRPLTLSHLCAIYERSGTVPDKPRTIYRKIIRLLLEEWDQQRSVRRYSQYAGFEVDRKEEFLEALAFHLSAENGRAYFTTTDLVLAYVKIHQNFALPGTESEKVVEEIESHTGLITEVSFGTYEFAHKALQEYLTASYILKLPNIPFSVLPKLPHESALAVALSSNSNEYLIAVINAIFEAGVEYLANFTEPFLRRLLVERVNLTESWQLGSALLALYTDTYFLSPNLQQTSYRGLSTVIFLDFVKSDVAHLRSVAEVIRACQISRMTREYCVLEPYVNLRHKPEPIIRRTRREFIVDLEFLNAVGFRAGSLT